MTAYRSAKFLKSVNQLAQAPADRGAEVAFAGRSNAGKSSALNAIAGIGGLARTSKTPGRTQLINYFTLDEHRRLVDLPGYGFARVPEKVRQHWQALVTDYLSQRESLRGLVLMMDARHPLTDFDRQLLDWCLQGGLAVHVLLTKADKLSRGAAKSVLIRVRAQLETHYPGYSVQLFCGRKPFQGVDEARARLDGWLGLE